MKRRLTMAMLLGVLLSGALGGVLSAQTQEANATQPAASAPTQVPRSFQITGVLVNAVTGEALPKAKVWIVQTQNLDSSDDQTPGRQGFGGRFAGGPGGGGSGPVGGGGFRGRGNAQGGATEEEPKTEAFTDTNGNFVIDNVTAGSYTLYAERKGFPRQPLDQHGNFNTAVVVGTGKESRNILFRVLPDSGIRGRIVDDFGDVVPNAQIVLFRKSSDSGQDQIRRQSGTNTDQRGNYHFNHLPPGTYYVVVSAQPWYANYARMMTTQPNPDGTAPQPIDGDANLDVAFAVTYFSGATDENDASAIQLQPGDHFEADMTMNTTPAMHLQFTNPDPKQPMMPNLTTTAFGQEIFVMPRPIFGGRRGGDTEQPTVTLAVAPGHYTANERAFNRGDGNQGGPPANARRETIDATGNAVIDMSTAEEAAPVTGTVKFEGVGDVPRGAVFLRKVNSTESVSGRANTDGEIQNLQLYPGKYTVTAGYQHYLLKTLSAVGAKVTGRTIEISGAAPVRISLSMIPDDARVEGVVHAASSDAPAASALVVLVPQDMANDEPLFRRFQSGSDGTFHFGNVAPGKYTVVAIQNGWNLEWEKPDIMKNYLAKGEPLEVTANGRFKITVKAQ